MYQSKLATTAHAVIVGGFLLWVIKEIVAYSNVTKSLSDHARTLQKYNDLYITRTAAGRAEHETTEAGSPVSTY